MHSTGVRVCFEQKKQSFSKIRSEDGYRGSDSEVTWKLLRWLTGMMPSFCIITEENERKFWPGLLRRTWYSVKVQFSSVQLLRTWYSVKVQFSSVRLLSHVRLCDPLDCSMPAFPVHHQLLELAQTHIHQVSDDIQPCHPLSSPCPPAFSLSQHQGLFQWVSSSHQVTKVLECSFSISPSNVRTDFL